MASLNRRVQRFFGALDIVLAILILIGVWLGLPARWAPIDALGTFVALALTVVGLGLVNDRTWAPRAGHLLGGALFLVGLGLTGLLTTTAGQLAGMYGPVGLGGAALLFAGSAIILPYLVIFPAAQFYFLAAENPKAPPKSEEEQ